MSVSVRVESCVHSPSLGLFLLVVFPLLIRHHQVPFPALSSRRRTRNRLRPGIAHPSCCTSLRLQQITPRRHAERDTSPPLQIGHIRQRSERYTRRRSSSSSRLTLRCHTGVRSRRRSRSCTRDGTCTVPIIVYRRWRTGLTRPGGLAEEKGILDV